MSAFTATPTEGLNTLEVQFDGFGDTIIETGSAPTIIYESGSQDDTITESGW